MRLTLPVIWSIGAACLCGCHHHWHEPTTEPVAVLGPPIVFEEPGMIAPFESGVVLDPGVAIGSPGATPFVGGLQNPLFVPVASHDAAWREIVDVVDDYFQIVREEQVHAYGDVLAEGRITTRPLSGATCLEPHRCDSVGRFNRLESTFQTIRRIASVRVVPINGGYLIDLIVEKELEDLPQPEHATAGAATFRSDGSLPRSLTRPVATPPMSVDWIPLGRDTALEQEMLADIRERLDGAPPGVVY